MENCYVDNNFEFYQVYNRKIYIIMPAMWEDVTKIFSQLEETLQCPNWTNFELALGCYNQRDLNKFYRKYSSFNPDT
ncbi:unnamed protein product [Clavelina lepadiformis]|uniref:Uncharacterized protein n=1 Tax=Clavelina lepadiformis TaxID=159417 RepID=A0ABP0G0T9_CLALP